MEKEKYIIERQFTLKATALRKKYGWDDGVEKNVYFKSGYTNPVWTSWVDKARMFKSVKDAQKFIDVFINESEQYKKQVIEVWKKDWEDYRSHEYDYIIKKVRINISLTYSHE
jgi:hypothetical protein